MPELRLPGVSAAAAVCLLLCCLLTAGAEAFAGEPADDAAMCAACHATPGIQVNYPNGETRSAYIDPVAYSESVHSGNLQCTACHQGVESWPHLDAGMVREGPRDVAALLRSQAACGECHPDEYQAYLGSRHAQALSEGDADAAVCSDCHGAHDIQPANSDQTGLALGPAMHSCAKCHEEQYTAYSESVHGRQLLAKSDVNMPVCVDCHGYHNMARATTAEFRRQSPYLCATCHADEQMMGEYGISTAVFNTYVADFHGASSQLFGTAHAAAPAQATCHDCHGTHNIAATQDPSGQVMRQNVQRTCQECHTDASARFQDAWLGHSEPSPTQAPLVYWIRQIYIVLIVVSIGALIVHILLDLLRFVRDHARGGSQSHA